MFPKFSKTHFSMSQIPKKNQKHRFALKVAKLPEGPLWAIPSRRVLSDVLASPPALHIVSTFFFSSLQEQSKPGLGPWSWMVEQLESWARPNSELRVGVGRGQPNSEPGGGVSTVELQLQLWPNCWATLS